MLFEVPAAGTRLTLLEFRADDRHYVVDLESPAGPAEETSTL